MNSPILAMRLRISGDIWSVSAFSMNQYFTHLHPIRHSYPNCRGLRALALLTAVMTTAGCAIGFMAQYEIRGVAVVQAPEPSFQIESLSAEAEQVSGDPSLRVEDVRVRFEWSMAPTRLDLRVTNRSRTKGDDSESLIVLLEAAKFVDGDGRSHDLAPIYRNYPSNVIAPGKHRVFSMFPADYRAARRALFEGPRPYFIADTPETIQQCYREHVGHRFRILLPIQVGESVFEYGFELTVSDIKPYLVREVF